MQITITAYNQRFSKNYLIRLILIYQQFWGNIIVGYHITTLAICNESTNLKGLLINS